MRSQSAAGFCVLTLLAAAASAQSHSLPPPPPPPQSPIVAANPAPTWRLEVAQPEGWQNGYRPVRFEIAAPAPSGSARELKVRYLVNPVGSRLFLLTVEQRALLPAGETEAELVVLVPALFGYQSDCWDVLVDGVRQSAISTREQVFPLNRWQGAKPPAKALSPAARLTRAGPGEPLLLVPGTLNTDGFTATMDSLPEPMNRWLAWAGCDFLIASLDGLQEFARQSPADFAVVRAWVEAGGSLWVEDVGGGLQRLPELSDLLAVAEAPRLPIGEDATGLSGAPSEWVWPSLEASAVRETQVGRPGQVVPPGPSPPQAGATGSPRPRVDRWFAEAPLGFGRIAAFEASWRRRELYLVGRTGRVRPGGENAYFESYRQQMGWGARHGMLAGDASEEFSNLLPAGVGLPPVNSFRLLISLFVLVAGPINYWLLRRRQRTYLMAVTVPVIAVLMTGGFLTFSVLSEGFSVRARARSLTFLDQSRGVQTSWNRTCYYAGVAPRGGLRFGGQTAVYPLPPDEDFEGGEPPVRRMEWATTAEGRQEQRLTRGWLRPRQMTQLLLIASRPSDARVEIALGDRPAARNRLGARVTLLLVRDGAGGDWLGESVADGETAGLVSVERPQAAAKIRQLAAAAAPAFPPGYKDAEEIMWLQGSFGTPYYGAGWRSGDFSLSRNRLNRALNRLLGLDGAEPLALPPRSFVAVSDRGGWLDFGMELDREEGSFHVVIGRW